MIKNVILDMGNVLFDYNPQVALDSFCTSEKEKEVIMRELFCGKEWIQADQGLIKNSQLFDLVKVHVPKVYWDALLKCCGQWDVCMKPLQGAKEFCEYVKSRNYKIFVLSNASDKFYDYFERLLPLDFFDGVVVSSDIHINKPDRKSYEYLLNTYHLDASQCLFIDDRLENVNAAKEVGICGYQFKNDYEAIKLNYLV